MTLGDITTFLIDFDATQEGREEQRSYYRRTLRLDDAVA